MPANTPVKHHRVAFVKRDNSCYMVPGHIVVGTGDTIRFSVVGQTNKVYVIFPNASIFGAGTQEVHTLDKAKNAAKDLDIDSQAAEGVYPFTAYCVDTKSFVIGGSDPEIIIQT